MGLTYILIPVTPTFDGLPTEIRDRIWAGNMLLVQDPRLPAPRREPELLVDFQLDFVQRPTPRVPMNATFHYSFDEITSSFPQFLDNAPNLRLVDQRSNREIRNLLRRHPSRRALRYVQDPRGDAGGAERLWFHPELDTIHIFSTDMMRMHMHIGGLFDLRHREDIASLFTGLEHVRNLLLRILLEENGNEVYPRLLRYFIPMTLLPEILRPPPHYDPASGQQPDPDHAETLHLVPPVVSPYFPNPRSVEFSRVVDEDLLNIDRFEMNEQALELVPPGQMAESRNGVRNEAWLIIDVIEEIDRAFDTYVYHFLP